MSAPQQFQPREDFMSESISERQAQAAFSSCVQNIAFNLVLSKQMVDGLRLVRDNPSQPFSPYLNPLVRRGLIVIEAGDNPRNNWTRLSRAGRLVVSLLEEAGMIPSLASLAKAA